MRSEEKGIDVVIVESYKDVIPLIMQTNLCSLLNYDIKPKQNFPCGIIENNIASVNFDNRGYWRYFTRDKDNTIQHSLSLIDIAELIYDCDVYDGIDILCELLNVSVKERKWRDHQKTKYSNNIVFINDADKDMNTTHPILYKYIKRHLSVLRELNYLGKGNIKSKAHTLNNDNVFFASSRYISESFTKKGESKSHTNINKIINMFTALGLIQRVPLCKVPMDLKNDTEKFNMTTSRRVVKGFKENQRPCYPISYYCIPEISEVILNEAQRRVTLLKENMISATGIIITNDKVKTALGSELYNSLFEHKLDDIKFVEDAKKIKKTINNQK